MNTFHCQRCEYDFKSGVEDPTRCSNCGSYVWDVPKDETSPYRRGLAKDAKRRTARPHEQRIAKGR